MSLSDAQTGEFTPMDIGSLDNFDGEISKKTDKTDPDFDRFTLLFDPSKFETREPEAFTAFFAGAKEKKTDPFKPLFDIKQKPGPSQKPEEIQKDRPLENFSPESEQIISHSLEEQAREQGAAKGYAEGLEKGHSEGYEKGFEKGRQEGFAKGETHGFAKAEPEGFAKGEAQGREKGEKMSREAAADILDSLQKSLAAVDSLLNDMVDVHEQEILDLVFKVAEKVVHASLDTRNDLVHHAVLDALKTLSQPREIELSIAPEDYEYIEMVKDSFFGAAATLQHVAVKSDPMIPRGGCRIETDTACVSTDPKAKLAAVYEAVKASGRI